MAAKEGNSTPGFRRPERVEMPTGAIPFEEHTPYTVTELGLDLDRRSRRPLLLFGVGVALAVLGIAAYLLTRGDDTAVRDLAPKDCYSPAVSDLNAAVHRRDCDGAHGAEFVALFSPIELGAAYPGAEELALFGEGACRVSAEKLAGTSADDLVTRGVVLRIAVPDEQAWEAGEHRVACSFATPDAEDLTKPVSR
jgi:hypothetical protein